MEEYMLFPLDKNGLTMLPYYEIDDVDCSKIGDITDPEKKIDRKSAENLMDRRKVWDFVKLLWKYLLILLLKLLLKIVRRFMVWPLTHIVKYVIYLLDRWWKRMIKAVSRIEHNRIKDKTNERSVTFHLYLDTMCYDDDDGHSREVWACAFRNVWWCRLRGYIPFFHICPDISGRLGVKRIDLFNEYVANGYISYGDNISTSEYHSDRTNKEKYSTVVRLAQDITVQLDQADDEHRLLFEELLVDPNLDFQDRISALYQYHDTLKIELSTDRIKELQDWNPLRKIFDDSFDVSILSKSDKINILDDDIVGHLVSNNPFYIPSSKVCIIPDEASLRLKKVPRIKTYDDMDIDYPINPKLKGVKYYLSPACQKAALSVLDNISCNRKANRTVTEYLLHRTNVEIQANQCIKKMGEDSEFDEMARVRLSETQIGKRKLKLLDGISNAK